MKKRIFALLLAAGMLTGCNRQGMGTSTGPAPEVTAPAEEQIEYDWMAGQSPVSGRRVGVTRRTLQGVNSDTGIYFIHHNQWTHGVTPPSPWILYMDRDSDTVIKLCGRPDCPHDTTDCNAFVDNAESMCFYNGYLYVLTNGPVMTEDGKEIFWEAKLIRMAPDGTERVELFNFTEFIRNKGYDFAQCSFVDDICMIGAMVHETDDSTAITSEWVETYLYTLDGSMEEPQKTTFSKAPLYNYGDALIAQGQDYSYWIVDMETGEETFLMDDPGLPVECFRKDAYYFQEGKLHRYTYETGNHEVVLETELTGTYDMHCFSDCFMLAHSEFYSQNPDLNLYIYNWNFEPVDTVKLNYPWTKLYSVSLLVAAETPGQIILFDEAADLPVCYIDKSELGTGNVPLHRINAPDFDNDQQLQEQLEDQEWFAQN